MGTIRKNLAKARAALARRVPYDPYANMSTKYKAEAEFWRTEIGRYESWYRGTLPVFYGTPSPRPEQRVAATTPPHEAILTWAELHQKPKYIEDLELPIDAFNGTRVLDVGAGPIPSGSVFQACELYCLDPLLDHYLQAGFPLHYYGDVRFVHGFAEKMPLADAMFDAVISVNALDHVDDFEAAAREIGRVLKPEGRLRIHLHYHSATANEPLELNDERVDSAFSWCPNFHKINESDAKFGGTAAQGEKYTLWSNF